MNSTFAVVIKVEMLNNYLHFGCRYENEWQLTYDGCQRWTLNVHSQYVVLLCVNCCHSRE